MTVPDLVRSRLLARIVCLLAALGGLLATGYLLAIGGSGGSIQGWGLVASLAVWSLVALLGSFVGLGAIPPAWGSGLAVAAGFSALTSVLLSMPVARMAFFYASDVVEVLPAVLLVFGPYLLLFFALPFALARLERQAR